MENNGLFLYEFHQYLKPNIERILSLPNFKVDTVVELGVFQGYFTFNMTHMMAPTNPGYKHYAVDPFKTSNDLDADVIKQAYECFINNFRVSQYNKHIEFWHMKSVDALNIFYSKIGEEDESLVDLIYIDGSHTADDVLCDLVMSWNILKDGGVILCDDSGGSWAFKDENGCKAVQKSPRLAVENFIQCYWDRLEIIDLPNNWQTAFRKS